MGAYSNVRSHTASHGATAPSYANYFAAAVRKTASRLAGSGKAYIRQDLNKAAFSIGSLLHLEGADETFARWALLDAALRVDESAPSQAFSRIIASAFDAGRMAPKTPPRDQSQQLNSHHTHHREHRRDEVPAERVSSEELRRFWAGLVAVDHEEAAPVAQWLDRRFRGWPLETWSRHDLLRAIPTPAQPITLPPWAACGYSSNAAWNRTPEQHLAILQTFDREGTLVGLRARAVAEPVNLPGSHWRKSLTGRGNTNGVLADDDALGLLRGRDSQRSIDALLVVEGEPDFLAVGATKPVGSRSNGQTMGFLGDEAQRQPAFSFALLGLVGSPSAGSLAACTRMLSALSEGVTIFLGPHQDERGEQYRKALRELIAIHPRHFDVRHLPASALRAGRPLVVPAAASSGSVEEAAVACAPRSSGSDPVAGDFSNSTNAVDDGEVFP